MADQKMNDRQNHSLYYVLLGVSLIAPIVSSLVPAVFFAPTYFFIFLVFLFGLFLSIALPKKMFVKILVGLLLFAGFFLLMPTFATGNPAWKVEAAVFALLLLVDNQKQSRPMRDILISQTIIAILAYVFVSILMA